jgi:tetratricopeptide (TPR) repeat protein
VTECDRLATHPADPDKPLPGVERKDIDLARAEAACRAVLASEPNHARSHYVLGRVLFYQGKATDALSHLERATALGYRQAVFVLGFVLLEGGPVKRDVCRAAELWQRAAALEHPWTSYYWVENHLNGVFQGCATQLPESAIAQHVARARETISVEASRGRVEALTARVEQWAAARRVAALPATGAPFAKANYSQAVTECDRMASHPDDPDRVAPGRERAEIDLPQAIAACEAAVSADPKNPRLRYQLGRMLGYAGRGQEALGHRAAAVEANYPQALFVIGYITMLGMNEQPKDVCRGAELIRRSAIAGRLAGQLAFPKYVLAGDFAGCSVKQDWRELLDFVLAARPRVKGEYYHTLLADVLEQALRARIATPR